MKKFLTAFTLAKTLTSLCLVVFLNVILKAQTPIAYYPFNGNANDAIRGSSGAAVLQNAELTTDKAGNENSAYMYYFDGWADDNNFKITIPAISSTSSEFSISLWAYNPNISVENRTMEGHQVLLSMYNTGGNYLQLVMPSSIFSDQDTYHEIPWKNGEWNYCVISVKAGFGEIYINGVFCGTIGCAQALNVYTNIELGTQVNSPYYFSLWNGSIDEVAFYDVALTQEQITNLYTNGVVVTPTSNDWTVNAMNGTMYTTSKVGIGLDSPSKELEVNGTVKAFSFITQGTNLSGNANNALKISSTNGYIEIGPQNTGWAHIYSDRPNFIFNKPVWSMNGAFSSYSTSNFSLQTNGTTRLTILNSTGNVLINKTSQTNTNYKLDVNGTVNATKFVGDGSGLTGVTQWTTNGSNIYYNTSSGNVLIGKASQTDATYKLDVNGIVNATKFVGDGSGLTGLTGTSQWTTSGSNIYFNTTGAAVLIGKTSTSATSNYKLDVAGKVRANEIVVNTTGADFVFEKDYKLPSLQEVELYIAQHKHLPDVAPAAKMEAEGTSVGEMQTKLLQKVEEMTLYLIELKKENEALKNENKDIKQYIFDIQQKVK